MGRPKGRVGNNLPVGALLDVLLVLDPARGLAPLALLAEAAELVELYEDLVGRVVVHLLEGVGQQGAGAALLAPAYLHVGGLALVAAQAALVVAAVRLQVVDVQLLQGARLVGLHAHAPRGSGLCRELAGQARTLAPLRVLLQRVFARLVVVVVSPVIIVQV